MSAEFGVGITSLELARRLSDDLQDLRTILTTAAKGIDLERIKMQIEETEQGLLETASLNRRRLKLIPGGKA